MFHGFTFKIWPQISLFSGLPGLCRFCYDLDDEALKQLQVRMKRWFIARVTKVYGTWWLIPLSKWVITPVISGLTLLIPFITGVITHLLSGISHQVTIVYPYFPLSFANSRSCRCALRSAATVASASSTLRRAEKLRSRATSAWRWLTRRAWEHSLAVNKKFAIEHGHLVRWFT